MLYLTLAFLSGAPALVYQVVWTREVALLAGSQVEAISCVVAVFFGGLALGNRVLGGACDRAASPLRLYGAFEVGAGSIALLSPLALRGLGASIAGAPAPAQLALAAGVMLPATFLLGGTLPALLRSAARDPRDAAGRAGWLLAANTAGAVGGVALAVTLIPTWGLRASVSAAGVSALAIGALALGLAPARRRDAPPAAPRGEAFGPDRAVLLAAALAGAATLAWEVLVARAAALILGSSLTAWGAVLGLVLLGLALGYASAARRARTTDAPATDLGFVEAGAAALIAWGASSGVPSPASPATGLSAASLAGIAVWVLPPAVLMGAALPFFVRLSVCDADRVGADFGALSAANTAGGIGGALLAPFALLPGLGLEGAVLACAMANALLAVGFLLASGGRGGALRAGLALCVIGIAALPALRPEPTTPGRRVIFVDHGRQATAVVLHTGGRRDLLVDGDAEASTAGAARLTEELLAAVPLALHPGAERFLEVGLGSGITLGTAARLSPARIECVEISRAVRRAAPYFAPDNRVAAGTSERVRVFGGDGRAFLARRAATYDVVVANTVHPWSVGATGLYSREYYERVAAALRPGGLAAQWLPVDRIGGDALAAMLRTFYAVFEEGGLYWAAESVIAVGAPVPLPSVDWPFRPGTDAGEILGRVGVRDARDLAGRRLADAHAVRTALGAGETLSDDLPRLETLAARSRTRAKRGGEPALLARIAAAGDADAPLRAFLDARAARAAGDASSADALEDVALEAGFAPALRQRAARRSARAESALAAGRRAEAERLLREIAAELPEAREPRFALGALAAEDGRFEEAQAGLEDLLAAHPGNAEAWNLLGAVRLQRGDRRGGRDAFARALEADPFLVEALANDGLLAAEVGDLTRTRARLENIRALSPLGPAPEEDALVEALGVR